MANLWKRTLALAAAPMLASVLAFTHTSADAKSPTCQRGSKAAACKAQTPATSKAPAKSANRATPAKSTASTTAKRATTKTAQKPATRANTAKPAVRTRSTPTTARATPAVRNGSNAAATAAGAAAIAALPASLAANTSRAEAASLRSNIAYVQDLETSTVLFSKNESIVAPIASISKLMTALVVVDANQPLDEVLEITSDDIDRVRHAPSRLNVGTRLTRADMLHLALMSSENRAANALGRHYPGGLPAFARAMNAKARALGMYDTHFVEPTGLSSQNVSSPRDLVRMIRAAAQRPLIHRYSTDTEYQVRVGNGRVEQFRNTNALVRNDDWDIKVSKTGFINEAGECLVMLTRVNGRDLAIVLLNSQGKYSRIGDAVRLRTLLQKEVAML